MGVTRELEDRIRARGVRVSERLALLRLLADARGEAELRQRLAELEERIRRAAHRVRSTLR